MVGDAKPGTGPSGVFNLFSVSLSVEKANALHPIPFVVAPRLVKTSRRIDAPGQEHKSSAHWQSPHSGVRLIIAQQSFVSYTFTSVTYRARLSSPLRKTTRAADRRTDSCRSRLFVFLFFNRGQPVFLLSQR